MPTIRFTKMHGAGNDYVYVNTFLYPVDHPEELAVKVSRRHFGVGSDGLVLIGEAHDASAADFSMRIFNADGSEATMCGNASRCVGKYLYERHFTDKTRIRLETLSGVKVLELRVEDSRVTAVTVDMLTPTHKAMTLTVDGREFDGTFVSMGNPHFVTFVEDVEEFDIHRYGPLLEHHEVFPDRCNIEFAQVLSSGEVRTRVWERGSGVTLACGTGACATSVAATVRALAGRENHIIMDGGTLTIRWDEESNHVFMTGGAEIVFDGEINI